MTRLQYTPVCAIDDYECLSGLSLSSLEKKLNELKITIEKRGIEKVGILLDADSDGIESKIELINQVLKNIGAAVTISDVNTWYDSQTLGIQMSCHILNVNGAGELETLLRLIKSKESVLADCLDDWKQCAEKRGNLYLQKTLINFG